MTKRRRPNHGGSLQRVDLAQNRATAEQADVLDDAEHEVAQAIIERIRNAPEEPDND
jgi:hypothetical protein